ncbi:hypothetical protein LJC32_03665 [Oscillospiraceae bacterium OttesenSCG-928-F05]|nr:hypothetical protein [Oscillospiraceae bacterium OttesenSCG-928-F05]
MEGYHIPANFTDAGKIFGLFEIRNTTEAVVLAVPLLFILFATLPFSLTTNIIITLIIVIPVGGFALIGIGDDCLTRYMRIWFQYRRRRKIITYRGGVS